mmetsp:Transcript_8050/g.22852  ORF Transcript_8050/g.22852 Transcript_8050/m.22852 type:complete len:289 (-) Transcript_8050:210-1076(-)
MHHCDCPLGFRALLGPMRRVLEQVAQTRSSRSSQLGQGACVGSGLDKEAHAVQIDCARATRGKVSQSAEASQGMEGGFVEPCKCPWLVARVAQEPLQLLHAQLNNATLDRLLWKHLEQCEPPRCRGGKVVQKRVALAHNTFPSCAPSQRFNNLVQCWVRLAPYSIYDRVKVALTHSVQKQGIVLAAAREHLRRYDTQGTAVARLALCCWTFILVGLSFEVLHHHVHQLRLDKLRRKVTLAAEARFDLLHGAETRCRARLRELLLQIVDYTVAAVLVVAKAVPVSYVVF